MGQRPVEIALALGSNIGDKLQNLRLAVCALEEQSILEQVREASVYESDPMYLTDQPTFMNTVVVGHTLLSPQELLAALKSLESNLGRETSVRNGPRLIDLDVILYEDLVISEESLEIPHPRMHERPFVLQPLVDILPDFHHPVTGVAMKDLWATLAANRSLESSLRRVSDRIR